MIFHVVLRRMAAAVLPLLAAGCASLAPPTAPGTGTIPSAATGARIFHDTIDLSGRLSVRYQGRQQEESLHGNFVWAQKPAQTTITLLSPTGQTLAVINVTPWGATLAQSGQSTRAAADVDDLTADTLGWPLPVAGMRSWLQGFAVDSTGQRIVASPENPDIVTRDGWRIHYANWQESAAPSSPGRPKRIDLARYTEQAGDVSIRIVIDTWQAH